MLAEIKKIPIIILTDLKILYTYKLAFSTSFLNIVFNLFYFILFGSMFGVETVKSIIPYGGDFISYLLIGTIGWGFLWSVMKATSACLLNEMYIGTLESILLTPTRLFTLMVSYSIYGSIWGLISLFIILFVGMAFFGMNILATATIYTLIIFILSITLMLGFGMIFGGLTLWIKKIGATVELLQNISMFFCGVYFPISILPSYLIPISKFIPFYYSIEGLRRSFIENTTTSEILYYISFLFFFSIVFIATGFIVLRFGLKKAKAEGSLTYY